jgi:hypothetical protein
MELDELKNMWNSVPDQSSAINFNITEMIYLDSKGPLAAFEKSLKITLGIFPFVVIIFAGSFLSQPLAQQSPTRWLLFTNLFIEFLFTLFNYGIVKKIQQPDGNIKQNLLGRVSLLQNIYRKYLFIHQGLYALLAVVLEMVMHYHLEPDFEGWGKVTPALRVAVYLGFLVAQFFVKRNSQKKHYGQYLDKLNTLINEME